MKLISVRIYPHVGHWQDVHGVYTWEIRDGALVLHTFNPDHEPPQTGVELLAVFAAGKWTKLQTIEAAK